MASLAKDGRGDDDGQEPNRYPAGLVCLEIVKSHFGGYQFRKWKREFLRGLRAARGSGSNPASYDRPYRSTPESWFEVLDWNL